MKKLLVFALLAGVFLFAGCGSDKSTQVSIPADDAPPFAPTGLSWEVDDDGFAEVTWELNTEPDLAGYRVYVYDPDPRRQGAYVLQNPYELLTEERWSCRIQYDQILWVRVTAVDAAGNESSADQPSRITWEAPEVPPATPPIIKPPLIGEQNPDETNGAIGTGGSTPGDPDTGGGRGDVTDGTTGDEW